jgi:hypothetical protein
MEPLVNSRGDSFCTSTLWYSIQCNVLLDKYSETIDRKCSQMTKTFDDLHNLYNKEQICVSVCPSMHSNCGHFRAEPITYSESA